jgi:intracellular sulfur oxidation DsrE/DsrF family protein
MVKTYSIFLGGLLFLNLGYGWSQEKSTGPVIKEFGAVFSIDNADFKVDKTQEFKAVFDIMESPEGHEAINPAIETAARFLNMHVQAGMSVQQLKVALVLHNKASKDIISDTAYRKKFGVDNPNNKLILAILEAGGQVILCGQSSVARGFPKEDFIPGVQLSLSAMTALIQLQNENYQLIKF